MKKKIVASLLALFIITGLVPRAVLAEETETTEQQTTSLVAPKVKLGDTEYDTLEAAVNAAESGSTITLGEGKYTLYNKGAQTKGKDLTFVGQGADKTEWGIGATIPDSSKFGTEYNGDYSFDGAGTVTFKNMTLQSGTVDYLGFIRADNTVVENCTINGKTFYWGYTSATFTNTTFNAPSGDYALWTYSSPTMTFDACTFNTSGKTINVFADYSAGKNDIAINFANCTVNSSSSNKSVLNINDSNMGSYKYIINISGTNSVSGLTTEDLTCSKLFGFGGKFLASWRGSNSGRTDVSIDGTTVWTGGKMVGHEIDCANDKYTDGYKDNAYTITYGEWTTENGITVRTVMKVCDYCGETEEYQEAKFVISYDANGGTGEITDDTGKEPYTYIVKETKNDDGTVSFSTNGTTIVNPFTKEGYTFAGWNTKADGTGDTYSASATLTLTSDLKLYAKWEKEEVKPTPTPIPSSTVEPKKTTGYDDGGPFTKDTCGNVFDRWGNKIYEAKGCASGYELVRTSTN